jgi:hypothetical protein
MKATPSISYAEFVADIKKTYSKDYLKAQHAMGVNVRHYKEWTKEDLVALYDSYFGRVIFDHIALLVQEARREETERTANPGRRIPTFAQNDLNNIAPHGLDWKGYAKLMEEAVAALRTHSFRITSNLANLLAGEDAKEETGFDSQAALAKLEKMSVSQRPH